jgi:hypothetical protein
MTWVMRPVHLLQFAGLLALVVAWPRILQPNVDRNHDGVACEGG